MAESSGIATLIASIDDARHRRVGIYHQRGHVLITIGGTSLLFRAAAVTDLMTALEQAQSAAAGYLTMRQQDSAAEAGEPGD